MSEVVVIDSADEAKSKGRSWLWILVGIILTIAIAVGGFVLWALNPLLQIDEIALNALESSDNITVTDRAWLAFLPHEPPATGIIIYPAARVPAEAYAPIARQLAESGYLSVIVYPPLNLPRFNTELALPVMEHFSAVENWVIAGHSSGGTSASIFASNNPDLVDGIVYLASYPAKSTNTLFNSNLEILSIFGTNDGLVNIENSRERFPLNTRFVVIEGANHTQFAYYGDGGGNNPATITREEQIRQTVAAMLVFLAEMNNF